MRNLSISLAVSLLVSACGGGGSDTTPTNDRVSAASVPNTTAQITVSSKEVLSGDNVILTWSSTNATSCVASGDWSGNKNSSGTESVIANKASSTYTISCNGVNASVTTTTVMYKLAVTVSNLPDYSNNVSSKEDIVKGLNWAVSSTTFVHGQDGKLRVFMFPSFFNKGPNLPAFELIEGENNKFNFVKFYEDVRLGFGRANSKLNLASTKSKQFVIVDHGLENNSDHKLLPHGHVYVATDTGSGFVFKTISSNKAFYHSVAVGDITDDKKDDIVVVNMGTNDPTGLNKTVYAFNQTSDGNFVQDTSFAEETRLSSTYQASSGSVATADLDNDGTAEVVHAAYINNFKPNWGAFRIYKKNFLGKHEVSKTYEREGYFKQGGAANTYAIDIDNDKDLDLIFKIEGNTDPNNTTDFNINALEIYRNDGNLVFTRVTDQLLNKSYWIHNTELYFTEISFIDFDGDGFVDIFLQQGGSNHRINSTTIDIGSMILKNDNGKGFVNMAGKGIVTTFANQDSIPDSFRIIDSSNNKTRIFGFDRLGVPTVVELRVGK